MLTRNEAGAILDGIRSTLVDAHAGAAPLDPLETPDEIADLFEHLLGVVDLALTGLNENRREVLGTLNGSLWDAYMREEFDDGLAENLEDPDFPRGEFDR